MGESGAFGESDQVGESGKADRAGEARAPVVAVLPAAGRGTRFGGERPKQYERLGGRRLIEHAIDTLLGVDRVEAVVLVIAADDRRFGRLDGSGDERILPVIGGATRAASVLAGVEEAARRFGDDAWALVHDAARPLVAASDICRLVEQVCPTRRTGPETERAELAGGAGGGILAARVADTLKRERPSAVGWHIDATVPREGLWQAQTPQLFRAGALARAYRAAGDAGDAGEPPTDEASVMERAGIDCLLVEALHPNFKITRPVDLALAEAVLGARAARGAAPGPDTVPAASAGGSPGAAPSA